MNKELEILKLNQEKLETLVMQLSDDYMSMVIKISEQNEKITELLDLLQIQENINLVCDERLNRMEVNK